MSEAIDLTQEIAGKNAIVTGRAKEVGSAANRLQRALDNGWASDISTKKQAIDNLWDAIGSRAVVENPTLQNMDTLVGNLSDAIGNGKISVTKVNSLVGKDGVPYLTPDHLTQLQSAAASVGDTITARTVQYDSGYTAGMVYLKYPSGTLGELQIMGPKVLDIANAEHIPYDAFLDKPYAGAFPAENVPHAAQILDPLRNAAKGLDLPQQEAYRHYLNENYINARKIEQGLPSNSTSLPKGVPDVLDIQNLIKANEALGPLKAGGDANKVVMRSPNELMGVEPASSELLTAIGNKRALTIATPGSEELRMLDYFGAEASVGGVNNSSILLRQNPSKAAALEEFLHGTQSRLGIVDRLGTSGLGSAETHVKDFMIRHQNMLELSAEDVRILQILRDKGL